MNIFKEIINSKTIRNIILFFILIYLIVFILNKCYLTYLSDFGVLYTDVEVNNIVSYNEMEYLQSFIDNLKEKRYDMAYEKLSENSKKRFGSFEKLEEYIMVNDILKFDEEKYSITISELEHIKNDNRESIKYSIMFLNNSLDVSDTSMVEGDMAFNGSIKYILVIEDGLNKYSIDILIDE